MWAITVPITTNGNLQTIKCFEGIKKVSDYPDSQIVYELDEELELVDLIQSDTGTISTFPAVLSQSLKEMATNICTLGELRRLEKSKESVSSVEELAALTQEKWQIKTINRQLKAENEDLKEEVKSLELLIEALQEENISLFSEDEKENVSLSEDEKKVDRLNLQIEDLAVKVLVLTETVKEKDNKIRILEEEAYEETCEDESIHIVISENVINHNVSVGRITEDENNVDMILSKVEKLEKLFDHLVGAIGKERIRKYCKKQLKNKTNITAA